MMSCNRVVLVALACSAFLFGDCATKAQAQIVINEAYVNSLKKGNKLTLQAKNRLGENLDIVINLAGFTATYDGESSLTVEEANKINTGEAALERILQQRAEETAKKLEGGATSSSSEPPSAAQ